MSDFSSSTPVPTEHAAPSGPASDTSRSPAPSRPGDARPDASGPDASGPGFAGQCFNWLAAVGPLTLVLFVAAQTMTGIGNRALFFMEELHLAEVYKSLAAGGHWAVLQFNGAPYVDLPPATFWLMNALERLLALVQPLLPVNFSNPAALAPLASACGLLFFVLACWLLAKATGNSNRVALAAGVLALTSLPVLALARLGLPDFLFASCVACSGACLYRAWIKNAAPLWMLCGFALAAAAALIQGPIGLAIPLLSSLLFLIWRGTFRRSGARDGALGFGVMLALLLGWVSWLALQPEGRPYLDTWLNQRLIPSFNEALSPAADWWRPAEYLLWIWMPWSLLVLFLPWERLFAVPTALWKNRRREPGVGWLWCLLLSGLALLCAFPADWAASLLLTLPALAVLTSRAVLGLSPRRSRLFFGLLGLLMLGGALLSGLLVLFEVFPVLMDWFLPTLCAALPQALTPDDFSPQTLLPLLQQMRGLLWLAAVCGVFALLSLPLNKRVPSGGLLLWLLFCTVLAQPVNLLALPSLAPLQTITQISNPAADPAADPTVDPTASPAADTATDPATDPATPPAAEPAQTPPAEPTVDQAADPTKALPAIPTTVPTDHQAAALTAALTTGPTASPATVPTAVLATDRTDPPAANPSAQAAPEQGSEPVAKPGVEPPIQGEPSVSSAPATTPVPAHVPAEKTASPSDFTGEKLLMATTTSTQDTGLLDDLKPLFEKETGFELQWISVGTGKALEHGKACDVEVLLVHAPVLEEQFVKDGYAMDRRQVMYNDFVLIGPRSDPSKIRGLDIPAAFRKFNAESAVFVSRGDNSGTHNTEKALWKAAGLAVPGRDKPWYVDSGQGMLAAIRIAAQKGGYTVTDRGTYIKYAAAHKGKPPMAILVEGDASLLNQYSVMRVSPQNCPKITPTKQAMAQKFIEWWVSPAAQQHIANFKLMDKQLFFPNAKGAE